MQRFMDFLEKYLSIPMAKLSEQRHLRAIRDGVVSSLPFIIVGSMFLIVAFPPVPESTALYQWAQEHAFEILIPYRMTMFIMSLYITFGIGYNLAKSYKLDPLSGGQIAVASFLLTLTPIVLDKVGFVLPMANLGGHGLFMAMIVSIFSVEVMRLCKKYKITIKMPEQVPPSVARSFEALIPVAFVILFMTCITVVLGIDVHSLVDKAVAPIVKAGDSLLGVLIPVFLITFFWSFGIHGISVIGAIARPVWEVYLASNAEAVAAGTPIPHIAPETFFQWFVWIGGSGATLGLVLAMLFFSKSSYTKALGKTTLIPSLFNINEPVIFGVPIVLNPMLIIPFITIPLITTTISYFATTLGFITPTYVMAPWTLPAPIGAYLATGGDWRAVLLVFINIGISFLIYIPFFKMYDQKLLDEEQAQAKENEETHSNEPNMA
ncbi:PTS system diacetylchitobiose-specific transporter subunit IIC [Listeria weihenstephanensis FSL R9-0317]|uniref:Permease IIC component n=1 Tax=Listeria weihenstephanensis TaxID=1006155 RepID=A0A1S7FST7_9LIST|nr:PTS sugar transporter subunit IIC [Listeria weihenstephanensis]AQY50452.1 PTS lactose transporter subunit IIC [Listeria weihenstephanensis]EUJ41465.1 PTS system diacetylchitobiose-specific transporter subunit IIC [Listeria weihenstephanensis FSL R9-0317]MBC1501562.1 PTS sugar transporter subunit IIC [Listeria weihenstephanensis]